MRPGMIAAMTAVLSRPRPARRPAGVVRLLLLAALLGGPATASAAPASEAGSATTPSAPASAPTAARALRLVSLNPSLTAIVDRLGASDRLVGIDDYSARVVPALADRPRVGGLFDPSLEAVLALAPDRVLLVAGLEQEAHGAALRRLGLAVEVFENERYEQVLGNLERLGRLVDREAEAAKRIGEIRALRAAVERAVAGRARPRTVIVLDRSPLYLVGGGTFLDEMLRAVGAENLGARVAQGYPRGSLEWLVAAAPELVLDLSPQSEAPQSEAPQSKPPGAEASPHATDRSESGDSARALAFWSRWPSLPAVKTGRVHALDATRISLPGPDLDRALRELAVAVHGAEIEPAIERALAQRGTP
ncbi:MAG: helical backbone metal receptor [Myxococcota bacterium]